MIIDHHNHNHRNSSIGLNFDDNVWVEGKYPEKGNIWNGHLYDNSDADADADDGGVVLADHPGKGN